MRTRLLTLSRLECVLWVATAACAGHQNASPSAPRSSAPATQASTPTGQRVGPGAVPSGASQTYVAEPWTEVALSRVRGLAWPPEIDDVALPVECLVHRLPLARTCRYPDSATQRLSEVLLDAYEASHPDPEQPLCESTKKAKGKGHASPTLAEQRRALDHNLAELEGCREFPLGFVRALRAHEEPKCADALAQIPLERSMERVQPESEHSPLSSKTEPAASHRIDEFWRDILYGQALAAVFDRWFRRPLKPLDTSDPGQFETWRGRVLQPYFAKGLTQLERARRAVNQLPDGSNGRAVAEQALWQAELRMVQNARAVPIPDALKKDYQSRTLFYGTFDEMTQPWNENRERHRLSDCLQRAEQGWLDDTPYFWNRSAIASQIVPNCSHFAQLPLPFPLAPHRDPRQSNDSILRLAATLPPAFVDALLSDERRIDPEVHRALLTRGTPRSVRQFASAALATGHVSSGQNQDLHLALARSGFRLGLWYFAPKSLERSRLELEFAPDTSEVRLLRALIATLQTAHPDPSPESPRGACLEFDTSALRNFLSRSASEPADIIAIAGAALARLALECPQNDYAQNVHTMLEQAKAGGAHYVLGCWFKQMPEARPFSVERQFDCGDPRSYPCLIIPWQGR